MEKKFKLKYLNVILTIIAILLLLLYLKPSGGITPRVDAQETNYSLVRDEGLANATRDVASANREIAASIDRLSDSVSKIADSISNLGGKLSTEPVSQMSSAQSLKSLEESGKIEVKKPE